VSVVSTEICSTVPLIYLTLYCAYDGTASPRHPYLGVHQINMKYELGGSRRRSLGFGILTGSALEGGELVSKVQSNLEFRLNSAMDVLSGSSSMTPMNRRRELMTRRREILGMGSSSSSSDSSSPSPSSTSGSGRITESGGSARQSSPSSSAGTPSMSDVEVGTKARAEQRGFDG